MTTDTFQSLREHVDSLPIEVRVANGRRWLTENFPGWQSRINVYSLNLGDSYKCICGQVFAEEDRADPAREH